MRIAIASGKGGTGKTTVAVNLALTLSKSGREVVYADCDVEEPNGHLFLKPEIVKSENVGVLNPQADPDKCDGCGECSKICRFSAIAVVAGKVLTFPELCHGCGGCAIACPHDAITETVRPAGIIETGRSHGFRYLAGRLNIGEVMPVPLIKEVKQNIGEHVHAIIDSPPGTSCPVIEAVRGSDFVLLVTEPTPFGLHDLKLAVDLVRELKIPHGVLINRAGSGDERVNEYCREENIELIAEIPHSRTAAESYARGELISETLPEFTACFEQLAERLFKIEPVTV